MAAVIPARNRAGYVPRAIQSVQAQTQAVAEIVVVDDGSSDDTAEVVQHLADADPRIVLIRHSRARGAQAARNTAIRAATSEWVAFLDSDDEWLPNSLAIRLDAALSLAVDVVHSECLLARGPASQPTPMGIPSLTGMVLKELLRKPGPVFPSLLVRKSALKRIGYLDEAIVSYQEWDTSIRLAKYFHFAFVPEPTFIYHCHQDETISKDRLREAQGYEQVIANHRVDILELLGREELARHYEHAAGLYERAGEARDARRCLLSAILRTPPGRPLLGRMRRMWRTFR